MMTKRIFSALLAAALSLSLLAGCGKKASDGSGSSQPGSRKGSDGSSRTGAELQRTNRGHL